MPYFKNILFKNIKPIKNSFERILERANLERIPIHGLRHTHVVLLLETEADIKYVQERLEHNSVQITSDVYAHISQKIEKKTCKNMIAMWTAL